MENVEENKCQYMQDMSGIPFCNARLSLCSDVKAKGTCPLIIQNLSKEVNNVNSGTNTNSK